MHCKLRPLAWLSLVCGLCLGACTNQGTYHSLQEAQRAQCDRLTDLQEMQRCRAQSSQRYDDYQHQLEKVKPVE